MQAERGRTNSQNFYDGLIDGLPSLLREADGVATIPVSSSLSPSSSSPGSSSGVNYIEHRVSKKETLAGVAIKYGVEVADIRRLNGLVTDLQMFAHKSLRIPLPGRHPPSPCISNGSANDREHTPPRRHRSDVLNLFLSLNLKPPPHEVSPAMSSLQGYYGLTPPKRGPISDDTEMAVYRTARRCLDDQLLSRESPNSDLLPSQHCKTRSMVNGFSAENCELTEENTLIESTDNIDNERSVRRRQKADASPSLCTPEMLLKEDNTSGFSGRIGKGLALRPSSGSRTDMDMGRSNAIPNGDPFMTNGNVSVRKSPSTSSLQDSEKSSSLWPTSMWTLKPDALARPIFDGLPKPNVRRNKAALD